MGHEQLRSLLGLVTEDRLRPASAGSLGPLIASESDKGRVVNAAAFRRLQQKAQVFPLDRDASVRTRLTHSIEVSQLGRYLVQQVISKLDATNEPYPELAAFVNIVETACLLHDIGNPPFGHLGETSIQEWFADYGSSDDLRHFDGNPQGFRLVSFLNGKDARGLNLTCSLLLSTLKYPWKREDKPRSAKKVGLFDMDWPAYAEACDKLGWESGKRFPFVRLVEAADDIAYSMSDLEDGLDKKIVRIEDLKREFGKERFERSEDVQQFVNFKTSVINDAVQSAAATFTDRLDEIMRGEDVTLLPKESEIGSLLGKVADFANDEIYANPAAEKIELAGRSVLSGLLQHFRALLDLSESEFVGIVKNHDEYTKRLRFHKRLFKLLPGSYVEKYAISRRGKEPDRRAHLIVDFIAGMTDDFALNTYQVLQGIRIR